MAMPVSQRPPSMATILIFAALLAGTGLYLVPALALGGSPATAVVAALFWVGGLGALWILHRRELRAAWRALEGARAASSLYRQVLENSSEAYLLLDPSGDITFTSPNMARVLGIDPERLAENGGLLDLVRPVDRRHVLQEFARVRRQPGASVALEVALARPPGRDLFLDVRATNLADEPAVAGILVGLRDITPRKTFESEIQHLAYYDALTGLANRRFFFEQGRKALSLARRRKDPVAVLYMDLDRFKQVNDALGHEAGDALLKDVAAATQKSLRDTDVVARLGGDEFAVILTEVRDEEAAGRVAHRTLEHMPTSAVAEGHEVPVGASIGIAMYPEDAETVEELLKAADLAMYRAKADGLGVQFYRPELREMLSDRMRLEQDMRRALEHHEFHLHYQPVYHIMTGEMVGAEALSRWRHLTRGVVAASEFIELAEQSGLIRALDRWAIARAIQQRKSQLDGEWVGWVAVNLSPQSLQDRGLPAYIREVLDRAELEPGSLVLELPEGAVFRDPDAAADLMWELKNTGAAIALDDYGAGPASYSQLRKLPIDILKLHPSFARGIGGDEGEERVVEGTIAIAHGLRAKVLAKGIERDDQVDWLRDVSCDFIQGYLMGSPVPAEELTDGLRPPERSAPTA